MQKKSPPRSCIPSPKIDDDCYDWYQRHSQKIIEAGAQRYAVVLVGDSLTHFWGKEGHDNSEGLWDELFDNSVFNLGFGFDRTQNVLWRLEHGEFPEQQPRLIIVNIGTNQFSITPNYSGDTPDIAAAGIIAVWDALHQLAPEATIVAMAIFPRGGKTAEVDATNRILTSEATQRAWISLVDLSSTLGDANHQPIPQYYQEDLCHLGRRGYETWANALKEYF